MDYTGCPKCKQLFICNAQNIINCHCYLISLSEAEQHFISEKFKGCLCNTCLVQLKEEFLNKGF